MMSSQAWLAEASTRIRGLFDELPVELRRSVVFEAICEAFEVGEEIGVKRSSEALMRQLDDMRSGLGGSDD